MSAVPTTSPLLPVQSDYDDDKDEQKPDASEGYSSDGSVYIDEDAESNDGSDEQENGDITDDNSDFEQEDGLSLMMDATMRSTKRRETSPRLVNSRKKLRPLPLSRRPEEGSFRQRRLLQTRPPSLRPFRSRR
jgi:hypothetical protein